MLKYDGLEHRRWPARVAKIEGPLLVLDAVFEERSNTIYSVRSRRERSARNTTGWIAGTTSFDSVIQSGKLKNFYCNVNQPPSFDGRVLSYIDLDIDVLVAPDLTYKILDVEDFEANAKALCLP